MIKLIFAFPCGLYYIPKNYQFHHFDNIGKTVDLISKRNYIEFFVRVFMMKKLERDFLINSLQQLEIILSVSDELSKAVQHFTQGNFNDPRHHANSKITNAEQWSEQDKLHLTSAVSEATHRASLLFVTQNEEEIKDLVNAKNTFLDQYVPRLTANTNVHDRISSVRANGQIIREELMNDLRREAQAEVPYEGSFGSNAFTFFFTVVSAAVVGGAYVIGNGMKK